MPLNKLCTLKKGKFDDRRGFRIMKYTEEYKEKLHTPQEAVKVVKSGDYVQYNSYNGNPSTLDRA